MVQIQTGWVQLPAASQADNLISYEIQCIHCYGNKFLFEYLRWNSFMLARATVEPKSSRIFHKCIFWFLMNVNLLQAAIHNDHTHFLTTKCIFAKICIIWYLQVSPPLIRNAANCNSYHRQNHFVQTICKMCQELSASMQPHSLTQPIGLHHAVICTVSMIVKWSTLSAWSAIVTKAPSAQISTACMTQAPGLHHAAIYTAPDVHILQPTTQGSFTC